MDYDFYLDKILYNYLDLENTFITTIQYVSLDVKNFNVFSNELTNQLLATCAELENIFRYILNKPSSKININKLLYLLKNDQSWGNIFSEEAIVIRNEKISINPFENLKVTASCKMGSPLWWGAYNKLKHRRYADNNLEEGNLRNVLYSLSGLFITIMYLHYIKFSGVNGKLHLPDERSKLFKLKNLEDNKHILFFTEFEEW